MINSWYCPDPFFPDFEMVLVRPSYRNNKLSQKQHDSVREFWGRGQGHCHWKNKGQFFFKKDFIKIGVWTVLTFQQNFSVKWKKILERQIFWPENENICFDSCSKFENTCHVDYLGFRKHIYYCDSKIIDYYWESNALQRWWLNLLLSLSLYIPIVFLLLSPVRDYLPLDREKDKG